MLLEHFGQLGVVEFLADVLDVHVGEALGLLAELDLAILSGNKPADEDLLAVQKHAIDLLDGVDGGLLGLEVDEAVALGLAVGGVLGDLAAEDVSEGGERVVHGLVVDATVQVLDEDVADPGATEAGISLAPHDTDRTALEHVEVHGVQSAFSYGKQRKSTSKPEVCPFYRHLYFIR